MIIAILALLGVPLWLVLGWLAAGIWHRRQVKQLPGAFEFKVRMVSGTYRNVDDSLKGRPGMALSAHDIIIVEKGLLIPRNLHFRVADGVQPPQPADPDQVKLLGDSPVTMQFRLDDGEVIKVAAPGDQAELARGPFFTDAVQDSQAASDAETA